jgi:hypothetical protein
MSESKNWTCPFCDRPQVLTDGQSDYRNVHLSLKSHKYGEAGFHIIAHACANPECREIALSGWFSEGKMVHRGRTFPEYGNITALESFQLRPSSLAKPQPEYIPAPLREDYVEACKIRDLSPKASATLSRRCLQGMIRDFCGISKDRLIDEIKALKKLSEAGNAPKGVEPETVEAIDHVRSIGNIGAHMEKDISVIVDVDPGEAQALIELIELLFDEWYVARHAREARLAKVKEIRLQKDAAKAVPPNAAPPANSAPTGST